jgi:hypothetical protein
MSQTCCLRRSETMKTTEGCRGHPAVVLLVSSECSCSQRKNPPKGGAPNQIWMEKAPQHERE